MADNEVTAAQQAQVEQFLRALDAASKQSGKDPATIAQEWRAQATASDWIMDTGLEGVGVPSTGPPHPPDPNLSGVDFGAGAEAESPGQGAPAWSAPDMPDPGPSIPHGAAPMPGMQAVSAGPGGDPVVPTHAPSWTEEPPLDEPSPEPSQGTTLDDLLNTDEELGYGTAHPH